MTDSVQHLSEALEGLAEEMKAVVVVRRNWPLFHLHDVGVSMENDKNLKRNF